MLVIELKELLHNLKDRDWDVNPTYKIDVNEAKKLIPSLERINRLIKLPEEVSRDDEIFKDDYADKNTQNGWIMCKDRLPELDTRVLIVYESELGCEVVITTYDKHGFWASPAVIAWQPLPKWEVEE